MASSGLEIGENPVKKELRKSFDAMEIRVGTVHAKVDVRERERERERAINMSGFRENRLEQFSWHEPATCQEIGQEICAGQGNLAIWSNNLFLVQFLFVRGVAESTHNK